MPAVCHLTAYVAGASELEYPIFAAFAYAGSLVWTTTFLSLGYFLGENWPKGFSRERNVALVGCAIAFGLALLWLLRRRRLRKKG